MLPTNLFMTRRVINETESLWQLEGFQNNPFIEVFNVTNIECV